jgi:hypothetical protein
LSNQTEEIYAKILCETSGQVPIQSKFAIADQNKVWLKIVSNPLFKNILILIKGAGDLASGVAYRLKRSGFPLIMTELPAPLLVRRTVAFGEAVYNAETTVEGITARNVGTLKEASGSHSRGSIKTTGRDRCNYGQSQYRNDH